VKRLIVDLSYARNWLAEYPWLKKIELTLHEAEIFMLKLQHLEFNNSVKLLHRVFCGINSRKKDYLSCFERTGEANPDLRERLMYVADKEKKRKGE